MKSGVIKPLVSQTVGLLAATTVLALGVNAISPVGIAITRALTLRELDSRYITAEEAKARHDAGQSLFLDARRAELFERGHIAGALNLPTDEFDQRFIAMADWMPKQADIVIYCDGRSCSLGRLLTDKLATLGYTRVVIFHDGWSGWKQRGWPME